MALIQIHDSYTATGVPAALSLKSMKAGEIPRTGPDKGGNTLVDDVDVAGLPHGTQFDDRPRRRSHRRPVTTSANK